MKAAGRLVKPLLAGLLALPFANHLATTAAASTLPTMDVQKGQSIFSIGLADANLDYALTDELSVGLSGAYVSSGIPPYTLGLSGYGGAVRATLRLGRLYNLDFGATISSGYVAATYPGPAGTGGSSLFWWQPALNVALSPRPPFERWTTRVTLGPLLPFDSRAFEASKWVPMPNVELGYRLDAANEVTLGGNSLVGWRRVL